MDGRMHTCIHDSQRFALGGSGHRYGVQPPKSNLVYGATVDPLMVPSSCPLLVPNSNVHFAFPKIF
jgi:hypothetical protein